MKAISVPVTYVLIFAITAIGAFIAFPWAYQQLEFSLDRAEMSVVKNDFLDCSKRIMEVARIGSSQKCTFSVNKGDLFVRRDGIYYRIFSKGKICDEHDWAIVENNDKIWQKCEEKGRLYWLRWFYPKNDTILLEGKITVKLPAGERNFSFGVKGYLNVEFETPEGIKGKVLEITRKLLEKDKAILSINIY